MVGGGGGIERKGEKGNKREGEFVVVCSSST